MDVELVFRYRNFLWEYCLGVELDFTPRFLPSLEDDPWKGLATFLMHGCGLQPAGFMRSSAAGYSSSLRKYTTAPRPPRTWQARLQGVAHVLFIRHLGYVSRCRPVGTTYFHVENIGMVNVVQSDKCPICEEEYRTKKEKPADFDKDWPGGLVYVHSRRIACYVPDHPDAPVAERVSSYWNRDR